MKKSLSKLSHVILGSFIDSGKFLVKEAIDPYEVLKEVVGGRPKYYSTVANLKRKGYLKSRKVRNKTHYQLTKKGERVVNELILKKMKKTQKWDRKWRILIFDIPENKRKFRNNVRKILREIGFYKLQRSVWVYPYDVIEYLYTFVPGFREGDWFEYIEADKVSSQDKIKGFFGLK